MKNSNILPILPPEYMADIKMAGGWLIYRDLALLENLKDWYEIRLARERINQRAKTMRVRRKFTVCVQ